MRLVVGVTMCCAAVTACFQNIQCKSKADCPVWAEACGPNGVCGGASGSGSSSGQAPQCTQLSQIAHLCDSVPTITVNASECSDVHVSLANVPPTCLGSTTPSIRFVAANQGHVVFSMLTENVSIEKSSACSNAACPSTNVRDRDFSANAGDDVFIAFRREAGNNLSEAVLRVQYQ